MAQTVSSTTQRRRQRKSTSRFSRGFANLRQRIRFWTTWRSLTWNCRTWLAMLRAWALRRWKMIRDSCIMCMRLMGLVLIAWFQWLVRITSFMHILSMPPLLSGIEIRTCWGMFMSLLRLWDLIDWLVIVEFFIW